MDGQQAGGQVSRIDVVSDAICPWCWVGKRNLDGALAILAAEGEHFAVHWRPYQLNPEMPREGVERAAYRAAKFGSLERSRDADARVAQAGAAAGLAFRHDHATPWKRSAHAAACHFLKLPFAQPRKQRDALQKCLISF